MACALPAIGMQKPSMDMTPSVEKRFKTKCVISTEVNVDVLSPNQDIGLNNASENKTSALNSTAQKGENKARPESGNLSTPGIHYNTIYTLNDKDDLSMELNVDPHSGPRQTSPASSKIIVEYYSTKAERMSPDWPQDLCNDLTHEAIQILFKSELKPDSSIK